MTALFQFRGGDGTLHSHGQEILHGEQGRFGQRRLQLPGVQLCIGHHDRVFEGHHERVQRLEIPQGGLDDIASETSSGNGGRLVVVQVYGAGILNAAGMQLGMFDMVGSP
jgi:hypothetical protein